MMNEIVIIVEKIYMTTVYFFESKYINLCTPVYIHYVHS